MPKLLKIDGKLVRTAAGLVATDAPETCSCCGTATCETVIGTGGLPDLTCAKVTGITVSLSGIALRTKAQQSASGTLTGSTDARPVAFDRSELSGSFCCFNSTTNAERFGCDLFFVSSEPVAWATQEAVDPYDSSPAEISPQPVHVAVLFGRGSTGAIEPTVGCFIRFNDDPDAGAFATMFTTNYDAIDGVHDTIEPWPWQCNPVGFTIDNAIPADHALVGSGGDDAPVLGYGGTIAITGKCNTTYCGTCAAASLAITIDRPGRPADPENEIESTPDLNITVVMARIPGDACVYEGTAMLPDGHTGTFSLNWNGQDWIAGQSLGGGSPDFGSWSGSRRCGADGNYDPTGEYTPFTDPFDYRGDVGTIAVSA